MVVVRLRGCGQGADRNEDPVIAQKRRTARLYPRVSPVIKNLVRRRAGSARKRSRSR
jgi:hypothetical protein